LQELSAKMRTKLKQWIKRYLPAEASALLGALLGAFLANYAIGNSIIAAYTGTVFDNIGYYGTIIIRDFMRNKDILKLVKNLIIEFGPSEILDFFVIRPFCLYIFPIVLENYALGIIIGKFAADIIFYIPTIISYELNKLHTK
jgi:hypothetical protein